MKTDELRAELRRVSDEIQPIEGDLPSMHRRVNRSRAITSAIAVVLMVVLVVSGIAIVRNVQQPSVTSTKLVPRQGLRRVDVIVVPATDSVRRVLERSSLVRAYARLPRERSGSTGSSGLFSSFHDAACALQNSPGFAIEASGGADITGPLGAALGGRARVFDFASAADAEVFMRVAATDQQVADVSAALTNDGDVASFTFVDHVAAMQEFRHLFADHPDLIGSTKPSDLPESFRIHATEPERVEALSQRYQRLPGVDTVITAKHFSVPQLEMALRSAQASAPCSTP